LINAGTSGEFHVPNELALRNIVRMDQPTRNTFGWQVRWTRNGKRTTKFFADLACGGKESALQAAQRYRNRGMPPPEIHIKKNCYRVEHRVRNGRGEIAICVWSPKVYRGRRSFCRFYVSRDYALTKERFNHVLQQALDWRQQQERHHQFQLQQLHQRIVIGESK
jgi:hypothetical protein